MDTALLRSPLTGVSEYIPMLVKKTLVDVNVEQPFNAASKEILLSTL